MKCKWILDIKRKKDRHRVQYGVFPHGSNDQFLFYICINPQSTISQNNSIPLRINSKRLTTIVNKLFNWIFCYIKKKVLVLCKLKIICPMGDFKIPFTPSSPPSFLRVKISEVLELTPVMPPSKLRITQLKVLIQLSPNTLQGAQIIHQ